MFHMWITVTVTYSKGLVATAYAQWKYPTVIGEWKNTNALFTPQAYGMDTCHISNQSISSQYIPGVLLSIEILHYFPQLHDS